MTTDTDAPPKQRMKVWLRRFAVLAVVLTGVWFAWYQGLFDPNDRKLVQVAVDNAPNDDARVQAVIEVFNEQVALKETGWRRRHGPWRYALNEYIDALGEVIERDPTSDAARQAAIWTIQVGREAGVERAANVLSQHHLLQTPSAALTPLPFEVAQSMLEQQAESHTDEAVRAKAHLALANRHLLIETAARGAADVFALPEKDHEVAALFCGGLPMVTFAREMDPDAAHAAAVKALDSLRSSGGKDLLSAEEAKQATLLFTRHLDLGVGSVAPEIVGVNLDGEAMRLSDFKGKVVLLDFWGDW